MSLNMGIYGQVCFHSWHLYDPVKLQRCTTGPVEPVGSIIKDMCCQTVASNCLGLWYVCCELYSFLSLSKDTTLVSVSLWKV